MMSKDIKLIEIQKSDSTKSIFSKIEKLATDRVSSLQKEN